MNESTAVLGIGYRDCSAESSMHAHCCRYYLDRYSRLLADFSQISKLVVHYLRTTYAAMQYSFGEHYRNHRWMGTREYLLTVKPSGHTCVYRFITVGVGRQYRTRIGFYLEDSGH